MNIICIALSVGLSFFLFYFTAPFVAGAEMLDMYHNNWWRFLYYQFTWVGTSLYRLFERIFEAVSEQLFSKALKISPDVKKVLATVCNLFYYVGILYVLLKLNDMAVASIVGSADFELAYGDSLSAQDVFGDMGILFGLLFSAEAIAADGGFLPHLLHSVGSIIAYIFFSLFFFSVVFGLLENKVDQPFQSLFGGDEGSGDGEEQPEHKSFTEAVKEFVTDFVGKIAVLKHFSVDGVVFMFGLIILLYAVVQDRFGVQCTPGEVLGNVLKQSGFIDMVRSFIFSALWAWLMLALARLIVQFLPESMQNWVMDTGTRLGEIVKAQQESRELWALEHDVLVRDFSDRGGGSGFRGARTMDLEGEYQRRRR